MLEAFFSRIGVCERLRSGPAGRHLDGFAKYLARSSYRQVVGRALLHAAWHFASWAQGGGIPLAALDGLALERFQDHLSSCHCVGPNGGRGKNARDGSRLFLRFLVRCGVVSEQEDDARNQRRHPNYTKPELLAEAPNQVWSWDITKLRGPVKWTYYYLYVILDIFSRYVVGWMLAHRESAALAQRLIAESCRKQDIEPDQLTLHADRGSSMRSKPVGLLLADLGVTKTHSRPYVSNDNPYSESQYLEDKEMSALLESVDPNSRNGRRDYALILFLYNTGARVQEVVDLKIDALRLQAPYQVKLVGKGRKERTCPLWPETVAALQSYLDDRAPELPNVLSVFVNANRKPITRFGIEDILNLVEIGE